MDATDNNMDNQELISALADGQLRGEAFARGVQAAAADARAREAWCTYHLVGEVLRTGRASTGSSHEAFLARLQDRLRKESAPAPSPMALQEVPVRPAANDWLWKLVAGVTSVAAVAAVGWNMWGASVAPSAQPQLASVPASSAPTLAEASAAPMVRDPRLDKLLAAHRQFGGGTALGSTSGFLRNATFDGPAR